MFAYVYLGLSCVCFAVVLFWNPQLGLSWIAVGVVAAALFSLTKSLDKKNQQRVRGHDYWTNEKISLRVAIRRIEKQINPPTENQHEEPSAS
jgi:nitric oxide reductase large subunit